MRIRHRSLAIATGALAVALILQPRPSLAVLISADDPVFGVGSLTVDTDTGLEWLDIPITVNLSVDDILGGAGGYVANGFRYATGIETRTFFHQSA